MALKTLRALWEKEEHEESDAKSSTLLCCSNWSAFFVFFGGDFKG